LLYVGFSVEPAFASKQSRADGHDVPMIPPPTKERRSEQARLIHSSMADAEDVKAHFVAGIPKEVNKLFTSTLFQALVEVVELKDFEHFDFCWGNRAAAEVYKPILDSLL